MAANNFRANATKAGNDKEFRPDASKTAKERKAKEQGFSQQRKPPGAAFTGDKTVTVVHQSSGGSSGSRGGLPKVATGGGGTVIACVVVATGLTSLNQLLNNQRSMRPVIGGFVVGTMLLTLAFFAPAVASALALLILVSSVLTNGVPIMEKVLNIQTS